MSKLKRGKNQASKGSKWLRPDKRLAIYLRDNHTCLWCNKHSDKVDELQVDHLDPYTHNKEDPLRNDPSNLITACRPCNSRRKDMSLEEYAEVMSGRTRQKVQTIIKRITVQTSQIITFYRAEAKAILAKQDAGDADADDLVQSTRARRKYHYEYGR